MSGLQVSVGYVAANRTNKNTVFQSEFVVLATANTARFTGWEPFINFDKSTTFFFFFLFKHGSKHSPSVIINGFTEI